MNRRAFLAATAGALASAARPRAAASGSGSGEVLYNGIRLPRVWPPRLHSFSTVPVTPPYLLDPPPAVPIDVGRQLFVDDFLIERTTLARTYHRATYYAGNPILQPETPWEMADEYANRTNTPASPAAMVFSDGVFYDASARLYKMWYMGGIANSTCLAISDDGLRWTRPPLDRRGTNIVLQDSHRDSSTVWLDHDEPNPALRFKMSTYVDDKRLHLYASADGVHWQRLRETGPTGDRSTFFYNPFRRKWIFSIRSEDGAIGRTRRYWETDDFFDGAMWRRDEPPCWVGADSADPMRQDYKVAPQLYNLDAVGYESLMLGLFTIWRGEARDREKPNDICLGFSRDGFFWSRPDRRAFIPVSEKQGDWNWANVQSAGGCCLVVGDTLRFYVSGRAGVPGTSIAGRCSTGVATLRRDGFASMDGRGMLLTRPLVFTGGHLFVNGDFGSGALRVSAHDEQGRVLPQLSVDDSTPVRGDGTSLAVRWKDPSALRRIAGRPVRLRFDMSGGRLFAFWVSRDESGASHGFVGAGGPGFRGVRDTVS